MHIYLIPDKLCTLAHFLFLNTFFPPYYSYKENFCFVKNRQLLNRLWIIWRIKTKLSCRHLYRGLPFNKHDEKRNSKSVLTQNNWQVDVKVPHFTLLVILHHSSLKSYAYFAIGYSHMYPQPPCSCTHWVATLFWRSDDLKWWKRNWLL